MKRIQRRLAGALIAAIMILSNSVPLCADDAHPDASTTQPASHATSSSPDPDANQEVQSPHLVGWLELSGPLRDGPVPFTWLSPDDAGLSVRRVVGLLEQIATDEDYAGVVFYLDEPMLDLAQVFEISQAIQAVRDTGRKVLVYAEYYDLTTYLLASSADTILLQRKGLVELSGLSVEEIYLAGLFEKVGMKADFLQVGRFKGAQEPLTRTGPSDEWNENIDALLDDEYRLILDRIAAGRGLDRKEVEQWLVDCWSMSDEQYVRRGLVDRLADRDLIDATSVAFGNEFVWDDLLATSGSAVRFENPFAMMRLLFQKPTVQVRRPSLALVHVVGPIVSGDSTMGGPFEQQTVGSRTLIRALDEAKNNKRIKAVVLRIDSPGGSALASELIWQSVRQLGEVKPVYVSIGSMAASGGYYIACAGHEIYASPSSVVGSIGVVGGKITLGGLYDKIGVGVYRRSRGPLGDMFNSVNPFTQPQRAALQSAFNRVYDLFTERVVIGRGKRIADIDQVAHGRLFTGNTAVQNGLVDKIGGVETALAELAQEVGLEPGEYDVVNFPSPQSLADMLDQWFNSHGVRAGVDQAAAFQTAKMVLGPRAWRAAQPVLTGLLLLRSEWVLTLLPTAVVIH